MPQGLNSFVAVVLRLQSVFVNPFVAVLPSTYLGRLLTGGVFLLVLADPAAAQGVSARGGAAAGKTTELLNNGWRFRQVGKDNWAPAIVPGCVHTDMLAAKQIEDPLYRDNETKLQWIGKVDWEYETTFAVTSATLQRANLDLVFKGLDTYANVTLNNAAILHADNMFREWRTKVKPQLKAGTNRLHIKFRSPLNEVAGLPVKYEPSRGKQPGRFLRGTGQNQHSANKATGSADGFQRPLLVLTDRCRAS